MPRNSHEDATAKALDLLPHDDPARSDPRLSRDAECRETIRATQEAAADVWLASSPLRAAPPEVLSSIMAKVESRAPLARRNVRFFPWLAASGWVAAAVTFLMWPREGQDAAAVASKAPPVIITRLTAPAMEDAPVGRPTPRLAQEDRRAREQLQRLQARMNSLDEQGALGAPRVLSLSSPQALQMTPEEAQRRVVSIFAEALRSFMEAETGAPGDPATMVIQRGRLPGASELAEDEVVRHLNFPVNAPDDYGLLVSGDGAYYDPAKEMIWTRDDGGRGYLGRRITDQDDVHAFREPEPVLASNAAPLRTLPEGFLFEDPMNNTASVLIDQVPPPAEGNEQVVIWTDTAGRENRMSVKEALTISASPTPISPLGATAVEAPVPAIQNIAPDGTCTLFFSLPKIGVKSFQLVELPAVANGNALNGNPQKVIVTGGRRSKEAKWR